MKLELTGYDSEKAKEILHGFTHGFPLYYTGVRVPTDATNLKSANKRPDVVRQKIQSEIDAGRVAGPFDQHPIPTLRVSPLGLVPKKEQGEFRLIHHLSYPPGNSLNDFIDPKLCSVQYTSFDEAIHMVQDLGVAVYWGNPTLNQLFVFSEFPPLTLTNLASNLMESFILTKQCPLGAVLPARHGNCSLLFWNFVWPGPGHLM